MASVEKIRVDDRDMDVHLGVPPRETPGPAVVLMYHRGSIDDFTKGTAARHRRNEL
jgi:hypothetical protein